MQGFQVAVEQGSEVEEEEFEGIRGSMLLAPFKQLQVPPMTPTSAATSSPKTTTDHNSQLNS
jgi:hypothetical protein